MNIWNTLQIAPTTDKKTIKRAYAKLAKLYHPEEKPEEFKQLYAAYQAALAYTEGDTKRHPVQLPQEEIIPSAKQAETAPAPPEPNQEELALLDAFKNADAKQKEFIGTWNKFFQSRFQKEPYQQWLAYMDSDSFLTIRMNPQVIAHIVTTFEQEWRPEGTIYEEIWKRYGFKKSAQVNYQGELKLLYDCLSAKIQYLEDKKHREQERIQQQQRMEQQNKQLKRILAIACVILLVGTPLFLYINNQVVNKKTYQTLVNHLTYTYPNTHFVISEERQKLDSGGREYYGYAEEYRDIRITAKVEKAKENNAYQVSEDYGFQILPLYAQKHGLKASVYTDEDTAEKVLVFYYPTSSKEGLEQFVDQFYTFMESEDAHPFKISSSFSFCPENVLFPEFIINGGEGELPQKLMYDSSALPNTGKTQLLQQIEASFIAYMYNYESWNLTADMVAQYGELYLKLYDQHPPESAAASGFGSMSADDYVMGTVRESSSPIHIYTVDSYTFSHMGQYTIPNIARTGYITVGNLYSYLNYCGEYITVDPDGRGFSVHKGGSIYQFGKNRQYKEITTKEAYSLTN